MTAPPRLASASLHQQTPEHRGSAPLDVDALADDLRSRVFPRPAARDVRPRIGAEVELIPIDAATGRPLPLDGRPVSTLEILRCAGSRAGWRERRSEKACVPEIELPDGGRITFEPGGQIEISAAPNDSVNALVTGLREVVDTITQAASAGVELVSRGIDPQTDIADVPPQLDAERYRRMLCHFERIGPSGARMMRQTASFQVCVDGGPSPDLTWRTLNALAPYMVAIFANSARYAGRDTGHRSFRRHVWGTLDPHRTGVLGGTDPVTEYLEFALEAPAFLLPDVDGRAAPFRHWLDRGIATMSDWRTHLSTLFPEVRPRGYFELRSADAVAPAWYAVPLVLVTGLVYHAPTLELAAELLGPPDTALLEQSGRAGLADPVLGARAPLLCDLALEGCRALGATWASGDHLASAAEYFDRYTRRRRCPADDV